MGTRYRGPGSGSTTILIPFKITHGFSAKVHPACDKVIVDNQSACTVERITWAPFDGITIAGFGLVDRNLACARKSVHTAMHVNCTPGPCNEGVYIGIVEILRSEGSKAGGFR